MMAAELMQTDATASHILIVRLIYVPFASLRHPHSERAHWQEIALRTNDIHRHYFQATLSYPTFAIQAKEDLAEC